MNSILGAGNKLARKLNIKMTKETNYRTTCEMCGRKLRTPETDFRNCAMCPTCVRKQYN